MFFFPFQLAKQYNGTYIDASAKTENNIDQVYYSAYSPAISNQKGEITLYSHLTNLTCAWPLMKPLNVSLFLL